MNIFNPLQRSSILFILYIFTASPIQSKEATDSGKLYPTQVHKIAYPKNIETIQKIVNDAHANKQQISIAGARHSQGGHSNIEGGIQIDLKHMNKLLQLDAKHKTVTVQAGMTWEQLQDQLQPHGLSIKIMQASNIFSIGGSISTNVHGRDPRFGPLIESIKSCKIITPSGDIKVISPKQNSELFSLVVGGYGLFGIIVEATLSVTVNVMCSKEQKNLTPHQYLSFFQEEVLHNPHVQLHYGRVNTTPGKKFCNEILAISYIATKTSPTTFPLKKEKHIGFNQWLFGVYRKQWGKITNYIKWMLEKYLHAPWENSKETSRNQLMRPYIHCLENKDPKSTDLLQEYFIPLQHFEKFMQDLKAASEFYHIKLLNTTLRYVPANDQSFLSYSTQDSIAFVLYFVTDMSIEKLETVKQFTQMLTNSCLKYQGTFYLPYQQFATEKQLLEAYPQLPTFIQKKQNFDPNGIFMNNWYQHYITKLLTQ